MTPGTRTELPWGTISQEVKKAIELETQGLKFINVNRLAAQIQENKNEYPILGKVPTKTVRCRCTHVMRYGFKWETYSNGSGRGTVFVKGD
jgi:hypothetical protein